MLGTYPKEAKLVFKHFPLSIHKFARKAAAAALAAHQQKKFWEFHERLFENYKSLNDSMIQQIAGEVGLDLERFNKDKASATIQGLINRDMSDARALGVGGTPAIFINGRQLKKRSLTGFREIIDPILKEK